MTTEGGNRPQFHLDRRLLVRGGVLLGVGGLAWLAGATMTVAAVASATRRWVNEFDVPPSEMARRRWVQAKSSAAAGAAGAATRRARPGRPRRRRSTAERTAGGRTALGRAEGGRMEYLVLLESAVPWVGRLRAPRAGRERIAFVKSSMSCSLRWP